MAKRAKALARGRRGAVGRQGIAGPRGAQGPPGPRVSKVDVLAMVDDQLNDIRKELSLQLSRMAQIQAQLDQIHTMVKIVVDQTTAK